jgi:hypothetical protein
MKTLRARVEERGSEAPPRAAVSRADHLEALVLGRYLLGADPPRDLLDRYDRAVQTLFPAPSPDGGDALVRFAVARPRALPYLDAAAAVLRPRDRLRQKLLVMAAVLEASPRYASTFLPRPVSAPRLAWILLASGVSSGLKALLGAPLILFVRRNG